jgi:DeoR family transcriptional regulator, suf operon transcriptional repressor
MRIPRPKYSRGEILAILCTGRRTADELAAELEISSPAVRKSLARLEEEGLVEYEPVRRSARKPAHEYRITPLGELSLSRAYLPFLQKLLEAQEAQLPAELVEATLRLAGRRLAPDGERASGDLASRAESATALLGSLGALASVGEGGGMTTIQCSCCAIGAIVVDHPLACKAMEAMLSEYTGLSARERCDRSGRPRCRFELSG